MIERRAFLFGCFVRLDNPPVSANIMNMTLLFLNTLKRQCSNLLRSHSLAIGFLHNERQRIPGIFQQFWLGFFSGAELRHLQNLGLNIRKDIGFIDGAINNIIFERTPYSLSMRLAGS
jgi:hypothetical protein